MYFTERRPTRRARDISGVWSSPPKRGGFLGRGGDGSTVAFIPAGAFPMADRRNLPGLPPLLRQALLGSALVAACTVSDRTGPNTDITNLVITPSSVALATSQSVQLRAKGQTTSGGTRDVQVSWSATGGTIDASGLYTADTTVGDFDITATLDSPHLTAAAKVHVRGSLRQLVLVPAQATVGTDAEVQFAAYGLTANGDSVDVSPAFTATGGTVTASGLYTAPHSGSTDQVI